MLEFKKCLIILGILFNSNIVCSQQNSDANNCLYYELGGTGYGLYSLNYERFILLNERVTFAPGIGISLNKNFFRIGDTKSIQDHQLFIPWQANFIIGQGDHNFELGFGMPIALKEKEFGLVGSTYVIRLGYRYQFDKSGLLLRASINPTLIFKAFPYIFGGISVGYSF